MKPYWQIFEILLELSDSSRDEKLFEIEVDILYDKMTIWNG